MRSVMPGGKPSSGERAGETGAADGVAETGAADEAAEGWAEESPGAAAPSGADADEAREMSVVAAIAITLPSTEAVQKHGSTLRVLVARVPGCMAAKGASEGRRARRRRWADGGADGDGAPTGAPIAAMGRAGEGRR